METFSDQLRKPQSYSMLLKSFGDHQTTQKLEEFLARLEEERVKIDAFKRELPLCMQLLNNAMEASRQQLQSHYANNQESKPVLEEFIPLNNNNNKHTNLEATSSDKANWMTSAQLWSSTDQAADDVTKQHQPTTTTTPSRNGGGAFHPFTREKNSSRDPVIKTLHHHHHHDLDVIDDHKEKINKDKDGDDDDVGITHESQSIITNTTNSQNQRKARRCWSPDLHRRFVDALHILGGSQVATPKQIRELMKVDGLTNDEVKSHLQKYRLHTRRPSHSPQATSTAATQLVVLGGIWVPQQYAAAAAAAAAHGGAPPTLYGAHPATHPSPHYYSQPMSQEFYHHHHQLQMYKPPIQTQTPPESDTHGDGGARSESIEDGKSESSSWKADSSAEMEANQKLWSLEKKEKMNNGSEITLKF